RAHIGAEDPVARFGASFDTPSRAIVWPEKAGKHPKTEEVVIGCGRSIEGDFVGLLKFAEAIRGDLLGKRRVKWIGPATNTTVRVRHGGRLSGARKLPFEIFGIGGLRARSEWHEPQQ